MKKAISNHTLKTLVKTVKHFFPNFLDLIKQLKDPRKCRIKYPLENIVIIELLNFLTAGKSQRYVETAFCEEKFLENVTKLTGKQIEKIFDSEIFTNVFSNMEVKKFEDLKYRMVHRLIRNKVFDNSKVYGCLNVIPDMTRFQKAHYEVTKEMLHQTNEGVTTWYQAVEEMKLIGNNMALSMCSEMVRNIDGAEKQDCEINSMKRILPKLHTYFPRLKMRIIGDGLYSCESFFDLCREYKWEYITVLPDERIPTVMKEYETLVGLERDNIIFEQTQEEIKVMQWVNEIPYKEHILNILEEITYHKETRQQTRWVWIISRQITKQNVTALIKLAKKRSYIENQGFREQKKTSGLELEHVYSKNYTAMQIIYQLIQIAHMILQLIEHGDIANFKKQYKSASVFAKKLYSYLIMTELSDKELEEVSYRIQIRFNQ